MDESKRRVTCETILSNAGFANGCMHFVDSMRNISSDEDARKAAENLEELITRALDACISEFLSNQDD